MRSRLRALRDGIRAWVATPEPWTDFDGPWSLVLLCAFTLPLALSGPLRALTSLSLPASLVLSLLGGVAFAALVWPRLRRRAAAPESSWWMTELGGVTIAVAAVWALYIRDFGGFPNLDGWDGGTHVLIKDQFATQAPKLYNGQVGYYALAWWLERLFGLDSFRSFTAAFYLVVVVTVAGPLAIASSVVRATAEGRRILVAIGSVVLVASAAGGLWLVVLPLLHYNQGAGYYVHVFGFAPLVMLWAADALLRQPVPRVLALLGSFVFLRYGYALNLADAALALAAVLAVDGLRGRGRIVQALLVAGLVASVFVMVPELRPIFRVWGGMQRFDVDRVRVTNLVVVACVLGYLVLAGRRELPLGWLRTPLGRALRFPLAFALASSGLLSVFRDTKGVQYYYVTKYQMWACMLLAFVAATVLAHLAVTLAGRAAWRRPSVWLRAAAVVTLLALAPARYWTVFLGYRTSLDERIRAKGPPYKHLFAVADVEGIRRVKAVLAKEHKSFGGYLTAFYPRFSFMNATLGYHRGSQEFFLPDINAGRCVFWVAREWDIHRLGPTHILDGIRNAIATSEGPCTEYAVPWKLGPQSLCYRCY